MSRIKFWRWLPGVVLAAFAVVILRVCNTPLSAIGLYGVGLVLTVLLPGMLVVRALRGRPRTLVSDLSIGFCAGLALQLIAWALFTLAGIGHLLFLWPLLVIVPMAVVPSLRHVWTLRPYKGHIHPVTAWTGVLAMALAVPSILANFVTNSLPPSRWYPDTYWHLSVAAELVHTVTPVVPQLASDPFAYHWFANAHFAAMSLTTGVDLILVVGRLWIFPILFAAAGILMAAADSLVGRSWPGVAASLLLFSTAQIPVGSWLTMQGMESITLLSPSQVFALPLTVFVIEAAIPALKNEPMGRRWWLLVLGVAALGGAKSSALPVFVCAAALVLLIALVRKSGRRGPATVLAILTAGVLCVSVPLSAASSAGTDIQLFAIMGRSKPWMIQYGAASVTTFHDPVLEGLWAPGRTILVGLILLCYLVALAWLLPAVRRLRHGDAVGWFLMGSGIAGFWGLMLVNQDGLSQAYFMRGAMICLCLLGGIGLFDVWTEAIRSTAPIQLIPAIVAGAGWGPAACYAAFLVGGVPGKGEVRMSLVMSLAMLAAFAALTVVVGILLRHGPLAPSFRVSAAAALASAAVVPGTVGTLGAKTSIEPIALVVSLVVAIAASGVAVAVARRQPLVVSDRPATADPTAPLRAMPFEGSATVVRRVSVIAACVVLAGASVAIAKPGLATYHADVARITKGARYAPLNAQQLAATRWVARYTPADTMVATNVHCLYLRTEPMCDARSFWVSGLGQRRVLLEGWAYTEDAHKLHGVNGRSSRVQPFSDPALLKLNDSAFTAPTKEGLAELYRHGVRFLFANGSSSAVEWDTLSELAIWRYGKAGPHGAVVYELKPAS